MSTRPSSKWKLQILSEKWRNESQLTVLPQVKFDACSVKQAVSPICLPESHFRNFMRTIVATKKFVLWILLHKTSLCYAIFHQVAGHGARDNTQALLSSKDGYALKPIQVFNMTINIYFEKVNMNNNRIIDAG